MNEMNAQEAEIRANCREQVEALRKELSGLPLAVSNHQTASSLEILTSMYT
jgi:hypothetical protein